MYIEIHTVIIFAVPHELLLIANLVPLEVNQ